MFDTHKWFNFGVHGWRVMSCTVCMIEYLDLLKPKLNLSSFYAFCVNLQE